MNRPKTVAIIGDAKVPQNSIKYELAYECGALLIDEGYQVVTGGMGGVMEAASRGARESKHWSPGSIIALLPGSDPSAANKWADVVVPTGLDHFRNTLVSQSNTVLAVGGGAGTLSEIAFAWIHRRLIVAMRTDGWSGRLADKKIDERKRYPELDDDRVFGANEPSEALDIIVEKIDMYQKRHSTIQ